MAKAVSLKQVAQEMNEIMMYGMENGKLVDKDEQIDLSQKEKALLAEIKAKAAQDLRYDDEESFSPGVWQWFIDNGIEPTGSEEDEEEEEDESSDDIPDNDATDEDEEGDDEEEEEEDEKPAKKPSKAKAGKESSKADKEEKSEKKKAPRKRSSGPSFEQVAIRCLEEGGDKKALTKLFTKLYKDRGQDDPDFISKRVDIYYNIALKTTGQEAEKKKAPAKNKEEDKKTSAKDKAEDKKASAKNKKPSKEDDGETAKKPVKKIRK